MRVLLDACVPERLAPLIVGHQVTTVRQAFGTTSLDDAELLRLMQSWFDVLVTVDKGMKYQQNLQGFAGTIVLLRAHSNAIEQLTPLVPQLLAVLGASSGHTVVTIGA